MHTLSPEIAKLENAMLACLLAVKKKKKKIGGDGGGRGRLGCLCDRPRPIIPPVILAGSRPGRCAVDETEARET